MDTSTTRSIADALTSDIVAHRLQPGAKLGEQKLATRFGVSRTLVRQALFQMAQNRLIRMEPARGAFVAAPSAQEAQQVFAVRRMLEAGLVRSFITSATAEHIATLRSVNPEIEFDRVAAGLTALAMKNVTRSNG